MKKIFLVLLLVCCACQAKKEHVVRINIGAEPQSLDPRKARNLSDQTIAKMFFEGLTRLSPEEKAEPALAARIDVSQDGKSYTFALRDAKWSNGDPITANDFVSAWKKVLDPNFPADQAFQLYVIKNAKLAKMKKVSLDEVGLKVIDDKVFQVELENPTPYFLDLLTLPVYFPVNARVDQQNPHWAADSSTYVGNGPFLMKEWKHSNIIEGTKNSKYWDAAHVRLKQLELVMVSEEAEFKMYEKKELDWAGSPLSVLPLDALSHLKEKKQLKSKPFLATYFFRVNVAKHPFDHPLVRKALALAINRQEIIDHITQGNQQPATGLVPVSLGLQKEPYFKDADSAGAKIAFEQALEEMKVARSEIPDLSLMYAASERNHLIAQAVQQQWQTALGIKINLEPLERKVYFDKLSKGHYQLAAGSWTADYSDPINFLEVFKYKNGGSNNTAWENEAFVKLLTDAVATADAAERTKLLQDSEVVLMDAMPIIPVFHFTLLYLSNDTLRDVIISSLGNIDFKWAYVAQNE